jgi:hypothetical protein
MLATKMRSSTSRCSKLPGMFTSTGIGSTMAIDPTGLFSESRQGFIPSPAY